MRCRGRRDRGPPSPSAGAALTLGARGLGAALAFLAGGGEGRPSSPPPSSASGCSSAAAAGSEGGAQGPHLQLVCCRAAAQSSAGDAHCTQTTSCIWPRLPLLMPSGTGCRQQAGSICTQRQHLVAQAAAAACRAQPRAALTSLALLLLEGRSRDVLLSDHLRVAGGRVVAAAVAAAGVARAEVLVLILVVVVIDLRSSSGHAWAGGGNAAAVRACTVPVALAWRAAACGVVQAAVADPGGACSRWLEG
jgi:hypothetical protein